MPVSNVQLMGNLTNVEMSVGNTGSAYVKASLAVNNGKDAQGNDKETLWFNVKAWGDLAENIAETYNNVTNAGGKSFRAVIVGKMVPEKWEDKDGNPRETSTVYVEDLGVSLRWAKVGSVLTSTNPLNNPAIQKGSDIKQPATTPAPAPASTENYNAEEDGAPF